MQRNGLYEIFAYPGTLRRTVTLCDFRGCLDGAITGGNPYDGRGVWRNNRTSAVVDTEPVARLYGTTTWNPVAGNLLGTTLSAAVVTPDWVRVTHTNPAGSTVDVTGATLQVRVPLAA